MVNLEKSALRACDAKTPEIGIDAATTAARTEIAATTRALARARRTIDSAAGNDPAWRSRKESMRTLVCRVG